MTLPSPFAAMLWQRNGKNIQVEKNYANWYNLVRSVHLKCHTFVASLDDCIYPEGAPAPGLAALWRLTEPSRGCACESVCAEEP